MGCSLVRPSSVFEWECVSSVLCLASGMEFGVSVKGRSSCHLEIFTETCVDLNVGSIKISMFSFLYHFTTNQEILDSFLDSTVKSNGFAQWMGFIFDKSNSNSCSGYPPLACPSQISVVISERTTFFLPTKRCTSSIGLDRAEACLEIRIDMRDVMWCSHFRCSPLLKGTRKVNALGFKLFSWQGDLSFTLRARPEKIT